MTKYLARRIEGSVVIRKTRSFENLASAIDYAGSDMRTVGDGAEITGPNGRQIMTSDGYAARVCGSCGHTVWYDGHDRRCGCAD